MIYFGQIWGANNCINAENGGIRNGTQQDLNQMINHYNDIIMGMMVSQITGVSVVSQPFIQAHIKENIKAPCHWPLCGEFTNDR